MDKIDITSAQNTLIKEAHLLKNRKERDEKSLFLVEGYREVKRALESNWECETLFYSKELFLKDNEPKLVQEAKKRGAKVYHIRDHLLKKLSYRDRPEGLIAVMRQKKMRFSDVTLSKDPFLLIAENIEKPGNLGTILRSSDAAGTDGVIVTDPCTDIHNPNVVRASIGSLFTQPVVEANNSETLGFLREKKIKIVAASPHAEKLFTQEDLSGPIAIVVGSEQYGLSDTWYNEADLCVKIPMFGDIDSLNVAAATILMLYEIVRQRHDS